MPEGGDSLAGLGAASTAYQTMAKTIDIASIWRQARRAEILMSRLAADKRLAAARDQPMP